MMNVPVRRLHQIGKVKKLLDKHERNVQKVCEITGLSEETVQGILEIVIKAEENAKKMGMID